MQDDQSDSSYGKVPLAEAVGLDPIEIKHSSLRGWEFPIVSVEISRRFSEAIGEQIRRILLKTHPHLPVSESSMIQRHAEVVAASLAKIMSAERLIQIISAKDQDAKKDKVDTLIGEIRDHLSLTAVYLELPFRAGRKRSEESRDAKILELRERDGLSFGKIAVRLILGSKGRYIASSAYQRAVKKRDNFNSRIYPQLKEIGASLSIQLIEENTIDHP